MREWTLYRWSESIRLWVWIWIHRWVNHRIKSVSDEWNEVWYIQDFKNVLLPARFFVLNWDEYNGCAKDTRVEWPWKSVWWNQGSHPHIILTGFNCGREVNECDSNPCQHGGSCVDRFDRYECRCMPGFRGKWRQIPNMKHSETCHLIDVSLACVRL